ncbi:malic enzyme, mitochondrial [Pseudohyphozyma bogoriensis]|nr:malic enzyme, mitochondrial [Pseudohyphozyma bogoriensis]
MRASISLRSLSRPASTATGSTSASSKQHQQHQAGRTISSTPSQAAAPVPSHLNVLSHSKNLEPLRTPLKGRALLNFPPLNKGAAFTREEREMFDLRGMLPYEVHDLEMQCDRAYKQLHARGSKQVPRDDLSKYTFLTSLRDQNQVLFYNLVLRHLEELLPIVYTPTVGEAIQKYSRIWRRSDGLFLTGPEKRIMRENMLSYKRPKDVDLIVVTDGEGILGIGDQGVGGILISIGKGNIYTLGAGIQPNRILPVVLDVGTNNQVLLDDPLYLGLRQPRMKGEEYDQFVERFCDIVREDYPDAFLHFEDFGVANAGRILNKFYPKQSCFNDDMQGTAAVVLAALMSACHLTKRDLKDQRIVVFGFGTAGLGIADGIRNALMLGGLTSEEARACFWVVDRPGLLTTEHASTLRPGQENFIRDAEEVAHWERDEDPAKGIPLYEVVKQAKPTIMIGCSTMKGAFSEKIVKEMAKHVERPVIFPLSNPTALAEATPADINEWTQGKALITTGSPFPPIKLPSGRMHEVAASNNALVYPGLGLGVIVSKASKLSDGMITAGVAALAKLSPALVDPEDSLLPSLKDLRGVSTIVATAVANAARAEGIAGVERETDWEEDELRQRQWDPVYRPLELVE